MNRPIYSEQCSMNIVILQVLANWLLSVCRLCAIRDIFKIHLNQHLHREASPRMQLGWVIEEMYSVCSYVLSGNISLLKTNVSLEILHLIINGLYLSVYIYIYIYMCVRLHYIMFTFNNLADAYMYVCMYIYIYIYICICITLHYVYINHLADAFIQSDCQMRIIEAIKPTKENNM